ncbi:MAG: sensor histidine kinase [Clostridiales bacterium]|nr:sensor histidine kinase [Clostridiales bacterium]
MKELSLNILDIAENSVKAKATLTEIIVEEKDNTLTFTIIDDGTGMPKEIVESVTDPFYTTRTTRKVGLGLPLLKMAAEQTGGKIFITSQQGDNHGTTVSALFYKDHIDFTPLGDVISTMITLIQGHPETDFLFKHIKGKGEVKLDTREIRQVLGDVPLNEYEVIKWISEYLREQYEIFK